ncbi:8033_t:CDS:2 [Gigaspora margarita]|uniref:8033_t:CDS:1 n=1 Tax=Gigaspora margarita TaxID=4874 RepID=A0ABM8W5C6_GIGMA|nr:8033_t:CDS:2 [Gigaspora margarita]
MLHGGKRGTLYLTSTCPVDTSLILIQSAFTHQDIYNQATAFALADSNSYTHFLLQIPVLLESNYFEACLKNWQMPCIVSCGTEFKAIDEELINIPENAFKINKYTSVETGNAKLSNSFLPFIYLPSNTLLDICIYVQASLSQHGKSTRGYS